MKKSFSLMMSFIVLILALTFQTLPVVAEEKEDALKLYAQSAVLMDGDSGRVLYEKDGNNRLPMASTTKIMTCIVALENGNLEDVVTVSKHAAAQPKVHLGMREGQQFLLKDLLYSLMLESHNDSAAAIAEHIGGSVEGFAKMMNQKAVDIGCFDTYYITPNGLDATATDQNGESRKHSTTATDLARTMRYCILLSEQKETFLEITRTSSYGFSDMAGKRSYSCNNHNAFLSMMEGALSGKTGFTNGAGYCYVGALQRDGKTFTIALLACGWPNHKSWKWHDTRQAMEYGLSRYEYREFEVPKRAESLKELFVKNGKTGSIDEKAVVPVQLISSEFSLLMQKDEQIEIKEDILPDLEAPVEENQEVGTVTYLVDGQIWKQDKIITKEKIEKIDYRWCFEKVLFIFLIGR